MRVLCLLAASAGLACSRSAARLAYPPWQRVFNVGFRVAAPAAPAR